MEQLDMVKAFAKMEGVELHSDGNGNFFAKDERGNFTFKPAGSMIDTGFKYSMYNPMTDLSLAMNAVIDYNVDIYHSLDCVNIDDKSGLPFVTWENSTLGYSIIECILKSKGLWV